MAGSGSSWGLRNILANVLGTFSSYWHQQTGARKLVLALVALAVLACPSVGACSLCSLTASGGERTSQATATPAGKPARVQAPPESTATASPTATASATASSSATGTATPLPTATSSPTTAPAATAAPATEPLRVHFVDVGQGDAILIQAPTGETALVDGGEQGSGILPYLQSQGVQHIDLMVATHPHADHIGGLVDVLRALPVAEVVTNGQPATTSIYEQFLDAIAAARARYTEVRRGDMLALGGLTLQVLHPAGITSDDLNDNSLVLRLVYGDTSFLLTGDVQAEGQAGMEAAGEPIQATILKVPHHGSRSSSPTFLADVHAQVAVYSCGVGNSYGHPHAETIAALLNAGAQVYGTDSNGTVVVTTDGSGYSLAMAKSTAPRAPPASAPAPTAAPTAQPTAGLGLDIVSLTSPITHGANATLTARTAPGANCTITVYYKSGASSAAGLGPQTAGSDGTVSWTWKVGTRTTPGTWRIVVTASANGQTVTQEVPFVVT